MRGERALELSLWEEDESAVLKGRRNPEARTAPSTGGRTLDRNESKNPQFLRREG